MVNREALMGVRDSILEAGHGAIFQLRRLATRAQLPSLDASDRAIVDELEAEGAYATDLDALGAPGSSDLLGVSNNLFDEMSKMPPESGDKNYMIASSSEFITKYPEILGWGLNERFLAIAENYIGMPVTYRGVRARLDMPDGTVRETRLWHLDQEDTRILKIVVYLSDVDEDGGPFEYIPVSRAQPHRLARGSKKRVRDDAEFDDVVPPEFRRAVIGPRGTVGFIDTCRMFHRGRMPVNGTRKTLFFAYNSRWPMRPSHCGPMFLVGKFKEIVGSLTPRQSAALDFGYYQRFE